jgi:glycosyltransferase involved in cell wall biosynthesis
LNKLAIITTHPIQYNAPFFKMLAERKNIELKVFYTWSQSVEGVKFDPGFGKNIEWDIPLLEGYDYLFSKNIAKSPGSHHFKGIENPTLIKEIESWKPTAVMVYGWSFKSHLKVMKYFKGKIPVLFRGDSTLLDEKQGIKKLLRRIYLKYIYSYIDIAMYAGKANKDYFLVHGIKHNQLAFMPHAIDNIRFSNCEFNFKKGEELRELLRIPKNAFVFLFSGKLESKKQPDMLAKAFISLCDKSSYLLIVGSGQLENLLKSTFSTNENLRFLDFQNQQQMPIVYAACNVFILPSKGPGETWGLAINEAMAAGKAIIASNACGASYDLVENKKNGFVFEKNNATDLLNCLQYFMHNKNEANRMGEMSLQIIKAHTYENGCTSIEECINGGKNNYLHED